MNSSYWNNLRPFEKRVVVVIAVVFFVVFNLLFVRPYFSQWGDVQERMFQAQRKLRLYQNEIGNQPTYERQVRQLESEGLAVPAEEQSLHFASAIQAQAVQSRVNISQNSKITDRTNAFFLEKSQTISVQAGEQQLVDFLYNLGAGNSLIRVRDLGVRPDPPRQQLVANVKLAASYQKKAPAKAAAPVTPTPAPRATAQPAPATSSTIKRP